MAHMTFEVDRRESLETRDRTCWLTGHNGILVTRVILVLAARGPGFDSRDPTY